MIEKQINSEIDNESKHFWESRLKGMVPIQLPHDFVKTTYNEDPKGFIKIVVEKQKIQQFKNVCDNTDFSLKAFIFSLFNVLIYRYTGIEDICFGSFSQSIKPDFGEQIPEKQLNFFPIRTQILGDKKFDELLNSINEEIHNNSIHAIPLSKFKDLGINENLLFKDFPVLFLYKNETGPSSDLHQIINKNFPSFEIFIEVEDAVDLFELNFYYSPFLFSRNTMERMASHFLMLLNSLDGQMGLPISGLQMLKPNEEEQILKNFNQTKRELIQEVSVIQLFEEQVRKKPNSTAIVFDNNHITFEELHKKANEFAIALKALGVSSEEIIPICLERSFEMAIAILGILKANASFIPIDPALPKDRISYMIEDSKANFIIASYQTQHNFEAKNKVFLIEEILNKTIPDQFGGFIYPSSNQLCYIIYTSGSTGKPKGVMIEHQNLINFLISMTDDIEFTDSSSMLSITTYSFDIFYLEFFLPLITGGKLYLASRNITMDGFKLSEMIKNYRPSHIQATPSGWRLLLDSGWKNEENVKMLVGGEALKEDIKNSLVEIGDLWNLYGPTETTIWSTFKKLQKNEGITIGKPIANTFIYILNKDNLVNPIGIAGELCIGGKGVGRGYFNRQDLTKEKFVPDPFQSEPGARMYKTGDLARWLPNGEIECLGRIDDQVKIRGYRIETGEIESCIIQNPEIKQVAVVAKEDQSGIKRLIAYVVTNEGFNRGEAIKLLQAKLPEYMVPFIWVQLEKLPLTFNGKIDKKALPTPTFDNSFQENNVEPVTKNEKLLANLWCRVLGLSQVGIHNDFFSLGGHSLAAMRLLALVRKEMNSDLQLADIFSSPTIHELSKKLSEREKQETSWYKIGVEGEIPLSFNQESLSVIDRMKGSLNYHLPLIFNIKGKLKEELLEKTFLEIIDRHEVLKAGIFELDGLLVQRILDPVVWKLEIKNIEDFGLDLSDPALYEKISDLIYKPFDLKRDIKLRATLIKITPDENLLLLVTHHIASDGWSLIILKKEISTIYEALFNGEQVGTTPLEVQYSNFSIWRKQTITEKWLEKEIPFWRLKLNGIVPLQLPTDFQRPPVQSTSGGMVKFYLDAEMTVKLNHLGKNQGATLFMTLLSAFKVFLYKYSFQDDICVGIPVAGRDLPELEELIGFFVNSVPVRTSFNSEMSFFELLDSVKYNMLEALEHRSVPFEKIVDGLNVGRDLSRNPIFQTMFTLQNVPEAKLALPGTEITEISHFHKSSVLDLTVELFPMGGGLEGRIEYSTDLFTQSTADKMATHYLEILSKVLSDPHLPISKINMLTKDEFDQVFNNFNPFFRTEFFPKSIVEMFEDQVKKSPDALAVQFEGKSLSYLELDKKSNQLAHYLIGLGIGQESKVPICLDRSIEMIVGIWGILKAGAAYVPIDPTYPLERIRFVLEDLNAYLILTDSAVNDSFTLPANIIKIDIESSWGLIGEESAVPLGKYPLPGDLAYVIYTSGTTGQPKGVLIEHMGLYSSSISRLSYYSENGATLLVPSFAFDSSVAVIFGTFLSGGKLILCRSEEIKNPFLIKELLKETEHLDCVPSYYRFLLEEGLLENSNLERVVLAGENLDEKLVRQHFQARKGTRLFNEYGPTEGTVWATVAEIFPDTEKVTIGKPIENTRVYIIGSDGLLQPVGIPGELCITGTGISRGYLNRPELNAKKFVADYIDKTNTTKIYKTGDLARWLPDGNLEYMGRLDDQVKIRGYRIELGEIQSSINSLDGADESVVILREDAPGEKLLVAYVVAGRSLLLLPEGNWAGHLKNELRKILPDYMMPNDWVFMDKLPLTSNGKIDKKNLPKPLKTKREIVPLKSQNEKLLADLWSVCLKKERIDALSDFFELGGNSLLAVKLITMLENKTGTRFPLNAVFKYPVLSELAKFLDSSADEEVEGSLVPIKPNGTKPPIYLVHGVGSAVSIFYNLAKFIDEDQPVYGFQPLGINGKDTPHRSIEEMAEYYISLMLRHNPGGPFLIGGFSFGGYVAFEMGKQLVAMGKKASKILVFDTPVEPNQEGLTFRDKIMLKVKGKATTFRFALKEPAAYIKMFRNSIERKKDRLAKKMSGDSSNIGNNSLKDTIKLLSENNHKILDKYHLVPSPIEIYLFKAENRYFYVENEDDFGWGPYVEEVHKVQVTGHHEILFSEPGHIQMMARKIEEVVNNQ